MIIMRNSAQKGPAELVHIELTTMMAVSSITGVCVSIEILLVLLDASANLKGWIESGPIRALFNIATETSIPTWFAVLQEAVVGVVVGLIAMVKRGQDGQGARAWMGWLAIALFFTYMSLDDGSMVHERVGSAFRGGTNMSNVEDGISGGAESFTVIPSFPSYSWQLIVMPFFALFGLYMLLFLWQQLYAGEFRWIVVALAIYAVAIGLDFVEGFDHAGNAWNVYPGIASRLHLDAPAVRHISQMIEEFLEMLGTTAFLGLFLHHLMQSTDEIRLQFKS